MEPTTETCDGADNNCDGSVDEGVTTTYYTDTDGDLYVDSASSREACSNPDPNQYVIDTKGYDACGNEANPYGNSGCSLCGDTHVTEGEACDDGSDNTDSVSCEPWETCPSFCTTSCTYVPEESPTCQQYQGDVLVLTEYWFESQGNPDDEIYGQPLYVDYANHVATGSQFRLDMTQYCSVSGDLIVDPTVDDGTGAYIAHDLDSRYTNNAFEAQHVGGDVLVNAEYVHSLDGLESLRVVDGSILISRLDNNFDPQWSYVWKIVDLSGLVGLEEVGGDLDMRSNTNGASTTLDDGTDVGFSNLQSIQGNLRVENVQGLTDAEVCSLEAVATTATHTNGATCP